jgi:hypothetical protein
MTVVPLPASPCVRVKLDYTNADGTLAGSRFYLSYAGSAPSATTCGTLATDIATAWNTDLAQIVNTGDSLTNVDVEDIATTLGLHGSAAVSHAGTYSGSGMAAQCANNVEFDIARRYRGGKPRMFLPAPSTSALNNVSTWDSTFITLSNTQMLAFFTAVEALSIGSLGALQHVNLSFYEGFTNVTNSSGRTRAAPKYRSTALVDTVTGYATKAVIGSQRRRRTASSY